MPPRSSLGWVLAAAVLVLASLLAVALVWALGSIGSYPSPELQSVAENDGYDVVLGVALFSGLSLLALGTLTAAAFALLRSGRRAPVSATDGLNGLG